MSELKKYPRISEAELLVMKVLWEKSPLTSTQVIEELKPHKNWSPKTIHTLIGRLVKKGALGVKEGSSPKLLFPLVGEDEYRDYTTKNFIERFYNGSLKWLVATFIENDELSKEELEEIKRLLNEKE